MKYYVMLAVFLFFGKVEAMDLGFDERCVRFGAETVHPRTKRAIDMYVAKMCPSGLNHSLFYFVNYAQPK